MKKDMYLTDRIVKWFDRTYFVIRKSILQVENIENAIHKIRLTTKEGSSPNTNRQIQYLVWKNALTNFDKWFGKWFDKVVLTESNHLKRG
jgi:hypothetical protein